MTTADSHHSIADSKRVTLPILLIGLGSGLAIDAVAQWDAATATIPALLLSGAIAAFAGYRAKAASIIVGPWLVVAGILSALRQMSVVQFDLELACLILAFGGLVLGYETLSPKRTEPSRGGASHAA